jgi:hypothetical protein
MGENSKMADRNCPYVMIPRFEGMGQSDSCMFRAGESCDSNDYNSCKWYKRQSEGIVTVRSDLEVRSDE